VDLVGFRREVFAVVKADCRDKAVKPEIELRFAGTETAPFGHTPAGLEVGGRPDGDHTAGLSEGGAKVLGPVVAGFDTVTDEEALGWPATQFLSQPKTQAADELIQPWINSSRL